MSVANQPVGTPIVGQKPDGNLALIQTDAGGNIVVSGNITTTIAANTPVLVQSGNITILPGSAVIGTVLAQGNVAAGAADGGGPVKIGGRAQTSTANVAHNQRVDALLDAEGKQVMMTGTIPENILAVTPQTTGNTTVVTLIAAQGANVRTYLTGVQVSNSNVGTGAEVSIKDGANVVLVLPAAANFGGAIVPLNPPLRLSANTPCNFTISANVSSVTVSAQGYKGS